MQHMVMVHQQSPKHHNEDSSNNSNQNRVPFQNGGAHEVWLPQNSSLRVKRPMLGGRRIMGGPCTPVPRWKLYENPFYDGIGAAAAAQQQQLYGGHGGGRNIAVSARKLAATLWELQEFPFSVALAGASGKSPACPCIQHRSSCSSSSAVAAAKKARDELLALAEINNTSNYATTPLSSSPNHSALFHIQPAAIARESMISLQHANKAWENVKRSSQSQSTSNRQNAALRSHVHRLFKERADARLTQLSQPKSGSCLVANQNREIEELHIAATQSAVVAALHIELDRVRARAAELELAHKSARRELDNLLKKVAEEKVILRNREQEKIKVALQAVKIKTEEERKARRRVESVNKKMTRELVDANITIAKAVEELEKERKARELMEDVCDELAREIGEDKAQVEELRRESAKVREEVEEERRMLQMAEVWREERVQMKLAEARLEIEEKNTILDNLRVELEAFLKSRQAFLLNAEDDEASCRALVQEAESLKSAIDDLQIRDMLFSNSCRSPDTDEAASGLCGGEQQSRRNSSYREGSWGWGASTTTVYGESHPRLATKAEVLERMRRKWEKTGQHSRRGGQEGDGDRKWENEWTWRSETLADDNNDEDGSQWESASEQDVLMVTQQGKAPQSSQGGRIGVDHQSELHSDVSVKASPYLKVSSTRTCMVRPGAEILSGDDLCKANTPAENGNGFSEEQKSLAEGSRNFHGRTLTELSRSSHMRAVTEQGTASPSRDWRSPDRGNPHIAMGIKGFIEWPKMYRENGVKGNKVFEAKVEKVGQQLLKQCS